MRKKKILFFVIDGLPDLPKNKKTPLTEAEKPNLDFFASRGICGQLNLIPKSMPVWSHTANIALLGYDIKKFNMQRGPLEAIGADLPYQQGHLALRANFATVNSELIVIDRRAGRNTYGLNDIARYINANVKLPVPFVFRRTYGHRGVLVINAGLSSNIVCNDPGKEGEKVKNITAMNMDALPSAKIVQDFVEKARELIEYHPKNSERIDNGLPPANYILLRDAGNEIKTLPSFLKKHRINKAVCIAENGVMKATCMLAGFNAITLPEVNFEESLKITFEMIKDALSEYDFIYIHIKGPDEPAHDGNFDEKVRKIEEIDKRFAQLIDFDGILVITSDHITSCELRSHVHGPVPVAVYGKGKDSVKHFDELSVKSGKLGKITGSKLMNFIFKNAK